MELLSAEGVKRESFEERRPGADAITPSSCHSRIQKNTDEDHRGFENPF